MNRKRNFNNKDIKQKKVMRCNSRNQPVFGYEVCAEFFSKSNPNTINNCENCKNSF